MTDLFAALVLAIVLEGLLYAAFPEGMKQVLAEIIKIPASTLRAGALACAAIGLVLLFIIKG